jgi:hypothetical protein
MNFFDSLLKDTIFTKCYCPGEATNEINEYRSQFDTMKYYQKTKSFTKQQLASLNIQQEELEEVIENYINSNFPNTETETYKFDSITKIVPEPNES